MKKKLRALQSFPRVAAHRLNWENYGVNKGKLWQFCGHDVGPDSYVTPLEDWRIVGWTPHPPFKGSRRNPGAFAMEHEDGDFMWWHFTLGEGPMVLDTRP